MPEDKGDKVEHLNEKIRFDDKPLFDQLKETVAYQKAKLDEEIEKDKEEEMTPERKIILLSKIFPIPLDAKVRNALGEDGIVTMVGLSHLGVQYLVRYPGNIFTWENYPNGIKEINTFENNKKEPIKKESNVKMDFPECI
jgi:hypothetical protein